MEQPRAFALGWTLLGLAWAAGLAGDGKVIIHKLRGGVSLVEQYTIENVFCPIQNSLLCF